MKNGLFKLTSNDIVKGAATAVIAAVLTILASITSSPDFSIFAANWGVIGSQVINVSITAFLAYLGKNFLSTNEGSVLGVTPNDKPQA